MKKSFLFFTAAVCLSFILCPSRLNAGNIATSWGHNADGQLGNASTTGSLVQGFVSLPAGAASVSGGYDHSLALMQDGTIYAWGNNDSGQFGDGTNTDSLTPVELTTIFGVTAVSAGYWTSTALKDGEVWAWGYGLEGELGNGSNDNSNLPVKVVDPSDPTGFLTGVTKISTGYAFSLALKSDGTVRSWGYNVYGSLGNGSYSDSNVAVQVSGLSGITAIAAGGYHALALKNDGTVYAWGYGYEGELGNGANDDSNLPVQVTGLAGATAIAAGGYHSLAIVAGGEVRSWGFGGSGQLGNGLYENSNVPVPVSSLTGAAAVSAGDAHSLARLQDQTVWSWGGGESGELGDGAGKNRRTPVKVSGLGNVLAVSAGGFHSLSIHDCVAPSQPLITGISSSDQCGGVSIVFTAGAPASRHDLFVDSALVSGGVASPCAYRASDGNSRTYVIRAVNGSDSCLTDSPHYSFSAIDERPSAPAITSISELDILALSGVQISYTAGAPATSHDLYMDDILAQAGFVSGSSFVPGDDDLHGFSIRANGPACHRDSPVIRGRDAMIVRPGETRVWCWGDNNYGQLGIGNNDDKNLPQEVTGLNGISEVSAGQFHSLGLKNDGTVRSWGWNSSGQLGNSSIINSNVPVTVSGLDGVTAVSAGGSHSLALRSDGTVWAWGANNNGQLGIGAFTTRSTVPVQVTGLSGVVAISAGDSHSMALRNDGTAWSWGAGGFGRLGNGSTSNTNLPGQVPGISGAVSISAGTYHSLALLGDGTMSAWGRDSDGALGDDSWTQSNVPVAVSDISDGILVSAGGWHSLGLKAGGSARAWGNNYYGSLGNGANEDINYPVAVQGLSALASISAGELHSLALGGGGTFSSWGYNFDGQLGRGDNLDSNVPVQVPGLAGGVSCSAGRSHSMALTETCQAPSTPVITSVSDHDPIFCDGVDLAFTPGAPAVSHDLYMDGTLVAANVSSPLLLNPGDSNAHQFTVRALNGACYADSGAVWGSDPSCACCTPPQEVIESVNQDKSGFTWPPTGTYGNYRVSRGTRENLAALGDGSADFFCYWFGPALAVSVVPDDPSTEAGRCYFYLIQGYDGGDPDHLVGPAGNSTAGARQLDLQAPCN